MHDDLSIYHTVIAATSVILATICYAIIPATNRATDNGDHKTFKILHRISVSFTIILLILNIAFPFLLLILLPLERLKNVSVISDSCEECKKEPWEVESLGKKLCNNCYGTNFRQAHESW